MNIFVTGSSGFIGSHLLKQLIKNKHNIFIGVRQNTNFDRIKDLIPNLTIINTDSLTDCFKKNIPQIQLVSVCFAGDGEYGEFETLLRSGRIVRAHWLTSNFECAQLA